MADRCRTKGLLLAASVMVFCVGAVRAGEPWPLKTRKAVSLIRISMQQPSLVAARQDKNMAQEFKIFKATQAQLIKSPVVLMAALRKPEIASLSIYQREKDDPVRWLQDNLEISFPGDAEIMQVGLADRNIKEAVQVVRAVVDAYLSEIVETERSHKNRALANLESILASKEQEIRRRRTVLKRLADELGTADPETLKTQMQLGLQQLSMFRQQLVRVQQDLRKARTEREVLRARLARIDEDGASAAPRPELQRITQEMTAVVNQLRQAMAKLPDAEVPQGLQGELTKIEREVNGWQERLAADALNQRRAALKEQIADMEVRVALATDEMAALEKEVAEQKQAFEKLGRTSVELEMMRVELKNLEEVCKQIATKREVLKIETKSAPRIRLLQRAEVPGG